MKSDVGLHKRGNIWHYKKLVSVPEDSAIGLRSSVELRGSTFTSSYTQACQVLKAEVESATQELLHGKAKRWLFEECVEKYLGTRTSKQMDDAIHHTDVLLRYLEGVQIRLIHKELGLEKRREDYWGVQALIRDCYEKGNTASTINHHLKVLNRILKLAHTEWRDDNMVPYLVTGVTITLEKAAPISGYPLNKAEENRLLAHLPDDLCDAIQFILHTGLRNLTACNLMWSQLIHFPDEDIYCFDLPANSPGLKVEDRAHRVVLNSAAREIIARKWGEHEKYVFTYRHGHKRKPYLGSAGLYTSSWIKAVHSAGLQDVRSGAVTARGKASLRVHDLRHSYATRLRQMGVSNEDRKDLLGHKNKDVTTGYSAAETSHLLDEAEKLVSWYKKATPLYVLSSGMKPLVTPESQLAKRA